MRGSRVVLSAATLLVLAACGGSSSSPAAAPAPAPTSNPVLKTATATIDGKSETILVGRNGMTLYHYGPDKGAGKVTCTDTCLSNWPPLLFTDAGKPTAGPGVTGTLGTLPNPDSGQQITYNGWPLYFFIKDTVPGDHTGQNVAGKWSVVTPDLPSNS